MENIYEDMEIQNRALVAENEKINAMLHDCNRQLREAHEEITKRSEIIESLNEAYNKKLEELAALKDESLMLMRLVIQYKESELNYYKNEAAK